MINQLNVKCFSSPIGILNSFQLGQRLCGARNFWYQGLCQGRSGRPGRAAATLPGVDVAEEFEVGLSRTEAAAGVRPRRWG